MTQTRRRSTLRAEDLHAGCVDETRREETERDGLLGFRILASKDDPEVVCVLLAFDGEAATDDGPWGECRACCAGTLRWRCAHGVSRQIIARRVERSARRNQRSCGLSVDKGAHRGGGWMVGAVVSCVCIACEDGHLGVFAAQ